MTFDESTEFWEKNVQSQSKAVADLHSKILDATSPPPSRWPNSFNFMQFLGNFGKIVCCFLHLGEALDPPLKSVLSGDLLSGNLEMSYHSTTEIERIFKILSRFMLQWFCQIFLFSMIFFFLHFLTFKWRGVPFYLMKIPMYVRKLPAISHLNPMGGASQTKCALSHKSLWIARL